MKVKIERTTKRSAAASATTNTNTTTITITPNKCNAEQIATDNEEESNGDLDFLPNLSTTISTTTTTTARNLILTTFGDMGTTIQSVPTLTTPTLTPTTLRSIEETFLEITNETVNSPYQAGFKPPPLGPLGNVANNNMANMATGMNNNNNSIGQSLELVNLQRYNGSMAGSDSEDSNGSYGGQFNDDQSTTDTSSAATDSTGYQNGNILGNSNGCINNFTAALAANDSSGRMSAQTNSNSNTNTSNSATPAPRRGGGRRPTRAANMSPEEEEKRRVRRERNKLAAARCRKRRVDQTNELTEEVEALQKKGETMRKEIEMLNATKNQLEFVLQAHRTTCQKITEDMLTVATSNGLIRPAAQLSAGSCSNSSSHHNNNSNDSSNGTITGLDATLNSTGRSNSPLDLKPVIFNDQLLQHIKPEPLDCALDSNSSLDQDGPSLPKRFAAQPLPNISTLTAAIRTPTGGPSGSLNTLIVTTAPVNFANFPSSITSPTLNALNKVPKTRPNTLPVQRPFGSQMHLNVDGKAPPTQIQGVPIQTPSTGTFNFDSLMDGGTGLTPVSGPLVPNCSSQNKHPLELPTPTTESSKLVSL
ncbi:transcription factor kayak isoform X2 [Scaptodrosophila lebanonensis]|uniref:Transcription factor kayak isoform X2 n=1 Tax=Drosophila lebanonensis TaxID=7225 RepID=A0A6J2T448_DROLE|nr:transcription factor kayak isoform X2 [Scaptodrosophila lebanonensis]